MSDTTSATAQDPATDTRIAALIGYGLFILAVANGITAIAGVVLAYIKRADARGTIWESHFTNMIHVFWMSIAVTVVIICVVLFGIVNFVATADTHPQVAWIALLPVLYLLGVGFFVWYLYRTVRGFLRALDNKPY